MSSGLVPVLDFTLVQCNTAHVLLDYNTETDDDSPDPEGESCCARMATLRPMCVLSRGNGEQFAQLVPAHVRTRGSIGLGFGF